MGNGSGELPSSTTEEARDIEGVAALEFNVELTRERDCMRGRSGASDQPNSDVRMAVSDGLIGGREDVGDASESSEDENEATVLRSDTSWFDV